MVAADIEIYVLSNWGNWKHDEKPYHFLTKKEGDIFWLRYGRNRLRITENEIQAFWDSKGKQPIHTFNIETTVDTCWEFVKFMNGLLSKHVKATAFQNEGKDDV